MAPTLDSKRLGRAVADVQDAGLLGPSPAPAADRLARIHAALGASSRADAKGSRRARIGAGVALVALGAAASVALLWPSRRPLHFAVGEHSAVGLVGVWIAASPEAPTPIAFEDGTQLSIGPRARARVVDVSDRGARIVVERGAVHVDVVPRPGNDWSVIGGPFEIHVTGTTFDASWDPERDELSVTMAHGRVVVRGPCLTTERTFSDGDTATISCTPRAPTVNGEPSADPASAAATEPRAPPPEAPAIRAGRPTASSAQPAQAATTRAPIPSASAAAAPSWHALSRAGQYEQALAAAESEGFGRLCDELEAADLMELATTARLGGRTAKAAEAYTAARRRFPGGDAAATAAFHLGQLAFDGAHAFAEGRRWFLVYLGERPGGALAAAALGRVMEAEERLGDPAAARATAGRYLERFPVGAHAALAKSLIAP
jgi:transmembrane sensor